MLPRFGAEPALRSASDVGDLRSELYFQPFSPIDLVELLAVIPHEYLIVETVRPDGHRVGAGSPAHRRFPGGGDDADHSGRHRTGPG